MLCITLYEEAVTRGDIGAGIGGQTGRYVGALGGGLLGGIAGGIAGGPIGIAPGVIAGMHLGTPLGGQLGRAMGGKIIDNPDAPADFSKASHRIGYLARANTEPVAAIGDFLIPGVGSVYGGLKNAISDEGAKRLGYDTIGRVAQGVSGFVPFAQDAAPLMGAISPSKIQKNR